MVDISLQTSDVRLVGQLFSSCGLSPVFKTDTTQTWKHFHSVGALPSVKDLLGWIDSGLFIWFLTFRILGEILSGPGVLSTLVFSTLFETSPSATNKPFKVFSVLIERGWIDMQFSFVNTDTKKLFRMVAIPLSLFTCLLSSLTSGPMPHVRTFLLFT